MTYLRLAGAAALAVGLVWSCRSFPTRSPAPWGAAHVFVLDDEECEVLRDNRATAEWLAPASLLAPVTVADVAHKFRLELPLVCGANDLPAACDQQTRAPGQGRLTLPLYREPPAAPASDAR